MKPAMKMLLTWLARSTCNVTAWLRLAYMWIDIASALTPGHGKESRQACSCYTNGESTTLK